MADRFSLILKLTWSAKVFDIVLLRKLRVLLLFVWASMLISSLLNNLKMQWNLCVFFFAHLDFENFLTNLHLVLVINYIQKLGLVGM